jgi:hypothetical protein
VAELERDLAAEREENARLRRTVNESIEGLHDLAATRDVAVADLAAERAETASWRAKARDKGECARGLKAELEAERERAEKLARYIERAPRWIRGKALSFHVAAFRCACDEIANSVECDWLRLKAGEPLGDPVMDAALRVPDQEPREERCVCGHAKSQHRPHGGCCAGHDIVTFCTCKVYVEDPPLAPPPPCEHGRPDPGLCPHCMGQWSDPRLDEPPICPRCAPAPPAKEEE